MKTCRRCWLGAIGGVAICTIGVVTAEPAKDYPPITAYLMERSAEIALARSAAPEHISAHTTVKVLTGDGYVVAAKGDNEFVCMVMRGFGAPTYTPATRNLVYDASVRSPICFDAIASRTVLPYQEARARLALEHKTPDEIAARIESMYTRGQLPKAETCFAYMFSADMNLGPGVGHFHPHMMVFAPYYTNRLLGDNEGHGPMPRNSDDEGTPFAVIVIPVDDRLAVSVSATTVHGAR